MARKRKTARQPFDKNAMRRGASPQPPVIQRHHNGIRPMPSKDKRQGK